MNGIIDPGSPRVMQRSNRLKSSGPSNGPSLKLLRDRGRALTRSRATSYGAVRRCASGVIGGILPSGGSTTSHARLPFVTSRLSRNCERADTGRAVDDLLLPLLEDIGQLRTRHILDPPSLEFRRPLERGTLLVFVGEVPLEVGIAPGRPGHGPCLATSRLRAAGCGRLRIPACPAAGPRLSWNHERRSVPATAR